MQKTAHSTITDRWNAVRERIARHGSARAATLIAVSKGQPAEAVLPLLDEGHRDFGENRIQEAHAKWPALKMRYPDIRLHYIGALQTNKAAEALELFDVIHTVDREPLVDALVKAASKRPQGAPRQFFIQVNTGEEPQKSGVTPFRLPQLMRYARGAGLAVGGLMCIPPVNEPPAPHFALLRKMAREQGVDYLSMGMSGDYDIAVRLGATHVRVGTEIFGERKEE